jgi:hypothetical protein
MRASSASPPGDIARSPRRHGPDNRLRRRPGSVPRRSQAPASQRATARGTGPAILPRGAARPFNATRAVRSSASPRSRKASGHRSPASRNRRRARLVAIPAQRMRLSWVRELYGHLGNSIAQGEASPWTVPGIRSRGEDDRRGEGDPLAAQAASLLEGHLRGALAIRPIRSRLIERAEQPQVHGGVRR